MKLYVVTVILVLGALAGAMGAPARAQADDGVESFLNAMYKARAEALITGRENVDLARFYDQKSRGGVNALSHETGRIQYMQSWAPARGLKVTDAETFLTNLKIRTEGDYARVSIIIRTKLTYRYDKAPGENEMGVGSWHALRLAKRDGQWRVTQEFYMDAMGDEWTEPYVAQPSLAPANESVAVAKGKGRLDRTGVTKYAETYCGAAWGCGNKADYNERYRSYRNLGGDCANFASQSLTEGGGLRSDWTWRKGGTCWVNAQAFVQHLIGNGRASLLARGTYPKVSGALSKLKPGDIIGYQRKGKITHVSVVTGMDSGGTPIVAAHTADRFRNPWDLGWDKRTVFWLVHLHE